MNGEQVMFVARKELNEIATNKGSWISALGFSFLFALSNMGGFGGVAGETVSIDWSIMYLSLFIGVFSGFVLCGSVFFREKQSGVIETLLCTPLNLRTIWLGKMLGVAIPSYLFALLSSGLLALFAYSSFTVAPLSLLVVLHLLVVAPLFTAAAIGIVGYIQLAMGMKENRLVSIGVFALLVGGLSASTAAVQQDASLVSAIVPVLLLASVALIAISYALSTRLNKEKIVTSIPD
ncbi:ABC transporter permease [Methanomassiliicoccus luminyensis]|uniref:ABC transporter permease n=1 Tax=Methanomassiliicoccus luminyensis TaxID=1080712 RepID=UPI0003825F2A|nr:ABC transporter permease [Methanomassiliicoccus luminyensis]